MFFITCNECFITCNGTNCRDAKTGTSNPVQQREVPPIRFLDRRLDRDLKRAACWYQLHPRHPE